VDGSRAGSSLRRRSPAAARLCKHYISPSAPGRRADVVFTETGKLPIKFDYRLDGTVIRQSIISINYRLIESRITSLLTTPQKLYIDNISLHALVTFSEAW